MQMSAIRTKSKRIIFGKQTIGFWLQQQQQQQQTDTKETLWQKACKSNTHFLYVRAWVNCQIRGKNRYKIHKWASVAGFSKCRLRCSNMRDKRSEDSVNRENGSGATFTNNHRYSSKEMYFVFCNANLRRVFLYSPGKKNCCMNVNSSEKHIFPVHSHAFSFCSWCVRFTLLGFSWLGIEAGSSQRSMIMLTLILMLILPLFESLFWFQRSRNRFQWDYFSSTDEIHTHTEIEWAIQQIDDQKLVEMPTHTCYSSNNSFRQCLPDFFAFKISHPQQLMRSSPTKNNSRV